jgi:hypothetical protein
MFNYTDPGGALKPAAALKSYRQQLHEQYRQHAKRAGSSFTLLEAFDEIAPGAQPVIDKVEWSAFPITAQANNSQIDAGRFEFQDEYVEWQVKAQGGRLRTITFTTDFLEYYQALAMVSHEALVAGIKVLYPTANPTNAQLYGPGFNPTTSSPEGRAESFARFAQQNPWNNGTKGILCLAQQFNTLGALFNLVGRGAVENLAVPSNAICDTLGNFCGSGRNSDPAVATAVQDLARGKRGLSFADPAGIRIARLAGTWKLKGKDVDMDNSPNIWAITRNGRRAVLKVSAGLSVDDAPITSGAQVAALLSVNAAVISAREAELPLWSRVGQETSRRLNDVAGSRGNP